MADVDPVTGMPSEVTGRPVNPIKLARLEAMKGRADQLKIAVASEKGEAVLHKIEEHLLNRINFLMENDGECKALKKLLVDMGVTISVGKKAVDGLMRLVKIDKGQ